MATPEDVNEQHLTSMGIAPGDLGQPYLPNPNTVPGRQPNRCPAFHEGFRCARQKQHVGSHARGSLTWNGDEKVSDQAKHCEEQVAHEPHRHGDEDWFCNGNGTDPAQRESGVGYPCPVQAPHAGHGYTFGSISYHCDGVPHIPTKQREGDQVLPKPGQQCVQDLVIAEMEESKRVGLERYGSTLQTFNSRKSIQDVAEEVRDLHVYLTQVKAESETDRQTLIHVVGEALMRDESQSEAVYGRLPIVEFAETAVDAIMGWVVGNTMGRFTNQSEIYEFLDNAHPGRHYSDSQILECMTHALGDRLNIPSEES